jgi:hypothetical protein
LDKHIASEETFSNLKYTKRNKKNLAFVYFGLFSSAFCFKTNSKHGGGLTRVEKLQTREKLIYLGVSSVSSYTICPQWGKYYFGGRSLLPFKYTLLISKRALPSNNALQRTMPNQQ